MLKKIWHDPVWSKVIANAIWTIPSLGVISYIAGWWPPIVQWIYSESSISNRLLLISSVLALWKVIDIALLINSPFRELHKAMKKFDNKSTNTDAKTTAPTNTPVWKTYNTIKQPTYGTQALD
jgi:hypothetical protein